MFLIRLCRQCGFLAVLVVAILLLQIDWWYLVDTVAVAFVLMGTLVGLLVSADRRALRATVLFLCGRVSDTSDLNGVHDVIGMGCIYCTVTGGVFSLLTFIGTMPAADSVAVLGNALAFSSLGMLYGLALLLVLLPAFFRSKNKNR